MLKEGPDIDSWQHTLEELLAIALEGNIDDQKRAQLNDLVHSEPQALELTYNILSEEALLQNEASALTTGEILKLQTFLPQVQNEQKSPKMKQSWGWIAGLAALLLLSLILGLSFKQSNPTPKEVLALTKNPPSKAIAHSILAFDAVIDGQAVAAQKEFFADQYALEQGSLELYFRNGVEILIEGPSKFTIESEMRISIHGGRIRTRVPEDAQGFTVLTPEVDVVDLGTEFGISVGDEEQTEVHVFSGMVELYELGQEEPRLVKEGFVGSWRDGQALAREMSPDSQAFKSPQSVAYERWERLRSEILSDPGLLIYYDFQGINTSKNLIINRASPGHYDGKFQAVTPVAGRWKDKGALLFEQSLSNVEIVLHEPLEQFSVCTWIKVDSFENSLTALFNSAGLSQNNFHWQIRDNGAIRTSSEDFFYSNALEKPVQPGEWIHLSVTYDAGENKIRVYANGRVVDVAMGQGMGTVQIGRAHIGRWDKPTYWPYERNFKGRIDEFIIYKRKLETREVRELYIKGSPAKW